MPSSIKNIYNVGTTPFGVSSDGTNVWVANIASNNVTKINISTGTTTTISNAGFNSPKAISSDGNNVYVANTNKIGSNNYFTVSQINISTSTITDINLPNASNPPTDISSDGTNIWVTNFNNNCIYQINCSTLLVTTILNGVDQFNGIFSNGTNVYSTGFNNYTLYIINCSTLNYNTVDLDSRPIGVSVYNNIAWISNQNVIINKYDGSPSNYTITYNSNSGISTYGDYTWIASSSNNYVQKINSSGNVIQTINIGGVSQIGPYGISTDSNYAWAVNSTTNTLYQIYITSPPPCFKEGTKILTDQGYKAIEDLRKGDLVKTLNHNYLPVVILGKSEMVHQVSKERIKNQLYECTNNKYPDVFEPLIITGCHSILVDWLTQEQGEKTMEDFGDIYETDGKPRLCAYLDNRASVYETPGTYTIYHLALENENYYGNYGIYANGLLVESCSKRYLLEHSNMEVLF